MIQVDTGRSMAALCRSRFTNFPSTSTLSTPQVSSPYLNMSFRHQCCLILTMCHSDINVALLQNSASVVCFSVFSTVIRFSHQVVGQIGPKWGESGTFYYQISVQFGATDSSWSEKVPDLSHLGPIWPILGPNPVTQEGRQKVHRLNANSLVLRA